MAYLPTGKRAPRLSLTALLALALVGAAAYPVQIDTATCARNAASGTLRCARSTHDRLGLRVRETLSLPPIRTVYQRVGAALEVDAAGPPRGGDRSTSAGLSFVTLDSEASANIFEGLARQPDTTALVDARGLGPLGMAAVFALVWLAAVASRRAAALPVAVQVDHAAGALYVVRGRRALRYELASITDIVAEHGPKPGTARVSLVHASGHLLPVTPEFSRGDQHRQFADAVRAGLRSVP